MNLPRILMVTPRRYERTLWRGGQVEFEDVISAIDDVDLIAPEAEPRGRGLLARQATRLAQRFANVELSFPPRATATTVAREYELFVHYAAHPADLRLLDAVPNWRKQCKKAVCVLDECWVEHFADDARWLERLSQFDLVAVMFYSTVEPLQKFTGAPCMWMPAAVDTLRFFPGVVPPLRSIDVYAMGRRSEPSHEALLAHASSHDWTYLFDTIDPANVRDSFQVHRQQLAELIKRTRYFVANKAKVDAPAHRGPQEEIGLRSFEGAAAGAVLLGDTPASPSLAQLFDWPDAHVHVPFGSREIADVIHQLDADPERVNAIRRNNVVNSLRRNDWAQRWQQVLDKLGSAPSARLGTRLDRLEQLAMSVDHAGWPAHPSSVSGVHSALPASGRKRSESVS